MLLFALAAPAVVALRIDSKDPCECLTWYKAYLDHNGTCHTGRELMNQGPDDLRKKCQMDGGYYTRTEYLEKYGENGLEEWWHGESAGGAPKVSKLAGDCAAFFFKSSHNYCVNWNYNSSETPGQQWCYVSSQCTELGMGKTVNDELSYKTCTSSDKKLADMPVYELQDIARKNDLDIVTLARWAYVSPGKWNQTSEDNRRVAKDSGLIHFYDSDTGKPPYRVIQGNATGRNCKQINFGMTELKGGVGFSMFETYMKWRDGKVNAVKNVEDCWNPDGLAP